MEVNTRAVLERLGVFEQRNLDFKLLRGLKDAGRGQRHAAGQLFHLHAGQVQRGALAGNGLVCGAAVDLHAAHARPLARRKDLDFFFLFYFAGDQRSGNHRAKAFHGKNAVNGQAEKRFGIARRNVRGQPDDFSLEFIQARAFKRAHGDNWRAAGIEKRSAHEIFNLHAHDAERVFVHHVGLGNHDDAARDGEQPADFEMLAGLRLDGFVGGDDHQHQVHAAHAGQHVADKALVARHVDEAQPDFFSAGRRQFKVGEAEIDGDAAALLFFQTVGINAGQGFDQRGLAVVDVSGGADDDRFHVSLSVTNCRACYGPRGL